MILNGVSAGHEQYALEEREVQHSILVVVIVKKDHAHPNAHNSFIDLTRLNV